MRYVVARFEQEYRDLAYRIYVTDSLRAITRFDDRFCDILFGKDEEDERSGDEIAAEVIATLGLTLG